jgi:NADPH:quinone reductase-like Zn-dependent oxidoreductase
LQAITVRDRDAGVSGLTPTDMPYPHAAENDVILRVHAAGFTPGELDWPGTSSDRTGRDRTPSIPGHELSGVVVGLGYGTTGLTVGQRVFGLTDWTRNGSLAEYTAVEARNLAPLAADIDHPVAAALPISGLTAWRASARSTWCSMSSAVRPSSGRPRWCAPAAPSSPSPCHPRLSPRTDARSSSWSSPTAPGSRTWPSGSGDGRLKPIVGAVRPLAETADAFARRQRTHGKTIIQVVDRGVAQS